MKKKSNNFLRFFIDLVQFLIIGIIYVVFYYLPFSWVSNGIGFIARFSLIYLPFSQRAYKNIELVMPELSFPERKKIVAGMWENFARTFFEYMSLARFKIYKPNSRVEVVGSEIIEQLHKNGGPAILFLAHLAHWELATMVGTQKGLKITQLYRRLNYPLTDKIINFIHRKIAQNVITKGPEGARKILETLKKGEIVSILLDQKLREGESIPFFGIPAMTPSAPARIALKFDCPFIPIQVERLPNAHFRVTYHPPLKPRIKGSLEEKTTDLLIQMNELFESWIRQHPEQWLWLHRRWPKNLV
ncbi:MAG: lysophospholipid acyltransferase family protein [Candidatus Paracaedimonas acanthamoebae]|uniref:Lysophospholipid acyltransferase family protein n=1 Tax=Candidatus Paracaedimonas acanthamoebae TaxID=244581 RepID=A0A8J7PZP4_9PROT|nr:lysophospholipid acyltransferase family protein [Candidatus Paracaedimonas acanthamoebae]